MSQPVSLESHVPKRPSTVVTPPGAMPPPGGSWRGNGSRKRRNWRKTVFRLHGWIGLNLGLLLFVVCFSGAVATLSHEIDWLLDARHRVPAQDAPYDWTAMHETVARTFPDGWNTGLYVAGASGALASAGARTAALAYVGLPDGQTRKVYLDPYTGALRGHTNFFNVQRFFRTFHRRLFDGSRGILIVTLWTFVLLVSSVSGFVFYRGWLKQLFTLRLSKGRRLRWSDLHKTIGVWGLAFSVLIALTGVFYFVEVMFQGADNYDALLPPDLPQVDEAGLAAFGPQPTLLPASAYVRAAEAAYPGLNVLAIQMPHAPGRAVYVSGQAGNVLTRDRADKVHLHPFTAEVLGIQKTSDLGVVPFITDAVDPLHFGYFGGLWTKILWFVFGLILSFSILSGTYLWVIRSETGRRGASRWLRGAPVAVGVTLAYLFFVAFTTVQGIQNYAPPNKTLAPVAHLAVGPYDVRIDCTAPCDTEAGAAMAVRFLGDGLPNYTEARLITQDADVQNLRGASWRPTTVVEAERGTPLTLSVTTRDGRLHEATFTPSAVASLARPGARWPDAVPGVWWVVTVFVVITAVFIVAWLILVLRAFRTVSTPQHESTT